MRINLFHAWLLALSDPDGRRAMPSQSLAADRWAALFEAADYHGALPAVVANARRALAGQGDIARGKGLGTPSAKDRVGEGLPQTMNRLRGPEPVPPLCHEATLGLPNAVLEERGQDAPATKAQGRNVLATLEDALAGARDRLIGRTALSLLIRGQLRGLAAEFKASGVPVAVLKGADFADHLYPDPSLRPFTDLDLLVPERAVADAEKAISRLGYVPCDASMKYRRGYGERSWLRPDRHEGTVEIHWNLVNSPTIRRGVGVAWEDLAFENGPEAGDGISRPTAPARLLIAAVHAAASHGFDRLGPLYDICLASRRCESEADIQWLSAAVERTGARLPLAAALALCRRLFDEPACARLQEAMRLPRRGPWSLLVTPGVVLRGHAQLDSFKRQLFREFLKRR